MKFYTREKKPKVYSIAVLTAAAALLLFAVVQGAPELLLPYGNLILTVYFAGVILLLALPGAKIINLDDQSRVVERWTQLKNPRVYYEFFKKHAKAFEDE